MRKYDHHKYTWSRPHSSSVHHRWEIVGAKGGIHLHVSIMDDHEKYPDPSCGLEFHHSTGEGAPGHFNCHLTGGRCWHDGTSLYATETVWPNVKSMMPDHDRIFRYLEGIADNHFEDDIETPN